MLDPLSTSGLGLYHQLRGFAKRMFTIDLKLIRVYYSKLLLQLLRKMVQILTRTEYITPFIGIGDIPVLLNKIKH